MGSVVENFTREACSLSELKRGLLQSIEGQLECCERLRGHQIELANHGRKALPHEVHEKVNYPTDAILVVAVYDPLREDAKPSKRLISAADAFSQSVLSNWTVWNSIRDFDKPSADSVRMLYGEVSKGFMERVRTKKTVGCQQGSCESKIDARFVRSPCCPVCNHPVGLASQGDINAQLRLENKAAKAQSRFLDLAKDSLAKHESRYGDSMATGTPGCYWQIFYSYRS